MIKTDSLLFIKTALYDLVYLLEFQSEKGADFYNKEIQKILNKFIELEENDEGN